MFFILTLIALLLLPGFFLLSLAAPTLPWFQRVPAGFSLSMALLGIPAVLLLNLHTPLSLLGWLALLTNLTLVPLYLKKTLPPKKPSNQPINQSTPGVRPSTQSPITNHQSPLQNSQFIILPPLLLLAAAILYLHLKTAVILDFGDHWFYLQFIRHYLEFPLDPALDPLAGQAVAPGTLFRAATNGWWVLIALLVQLSGQPLLEAYWLYLPPALMVVSLLAFYGLAWELFKSHQAALTAVLLQLLLYLTSIGSHDWIGQGFFTRIAEDKYIVSLILLPISFTFLLRHINSNQWRFLILLAGSIAAIAITHPFGLLQFAFGVACFAIIYIPLHWNRKAWAKSAVLLAPLLLFLIIPIIQQLSSNAAPLLQFNPAELQTPPNDTHLMVLSAESNRYLLHPHPIFHPLMLLGILLAPFLLVKIRQRVAAQFLFATTIIPLALLYNPITAPFFGRFISPLLMWRITWILPTSLVLAYLLNQLGRRVATGLGPAQAGHKGRPYRGWVGKWVTAESVVVVAVLALAFSLSAYISDGVDLLQDYKTRRISDSQFALLQYLCEGERLSGVLVADPALNTLLPSCAPNITLLTYRIFQARPTAAEEINRFYQSRLVSQATIDFLTRWQTEYLLVPHNVPVASQIALLPDSFPKLYANDAYSLYEFSDTPHSTIQANEALIRGDMAQIEALYNEALEPESSPAPALNPLDELLALGDRYNEDGTTNQAVAAYETVIEAEDGLLALSGGPSFWRVWSRSLTFDRRPERLQAAYLALGQIYEKKGDWEAAESTYRQLIRLLPTREISYTALAAALAASGKETEVITLYEEAARLNFHLTWPYLRLAEQYLTQYEANTSQTANLTRALAALQRAQQIEPDNREGSHLLARFYQLRGQPQQTAAVYEAAAEQLSWLAWPLVSLGQYYLDRGDFEAAEIALTTAIYRQPGEQAAYNLLADTYINRQEAPLAVELYQTAVAANGERAWPYLGLGNAYLAAGSRELALSALQDGLSREPDNAAVYSTLGNIYRWNVGDAETAVGYYRQSITLDPANADVYMALASTLIALGREEEALPYLDNGLALAPRSSAIYQAAGDMMGQIGRVEAAKQYYQQALAWDGRNAFAHLGLSRLYRQQGAYEAALEHAQAAVRFSQSPHATGPAQMEQGQIYLALGRPEEARPHLLAAVEALPTDPWFRAAVGDYYHYQQNDPAQAVPYYQAAAELAPQQAIFQAALGTALYDTGEVAAAVPVMEKAIALGANDAAVFLHIGSVLNKYGDWEQLVAFYETAVANNIQNADIFTQLGNAYSALGQEEKALAQFEKAADLLDQ